jgi:hypothetical protein
LANSCSARQRERELHYQSLGHRERENAAAPEPIYLGTEIWATYGAFKLAPPPRTQQFIQRQQNSLAESLFSASREGGSLLNFARAHRETRAPGNIFKSSVNNAHAHTAQVNKSHFNQMHRNALSLLFDFARVQKARASISTALLFNFKQLATLFGYLLLKLAFEERVLIKTGSF